MTSQGPTPPRTKSSRSNPSAAGRPPPVWELSFPETQRAHGVLSRERAGSTETLRASCTAQPPTAPSGRVRPCLGPQGPREGQAQADSVLCPLLSLPPPRGHPRGPSPRQSGWCLGPRASCLRRSASTEGSWWPEERWPSGPRAILASSVTPAIGPPRPSR